MPSIRYLLPLYAVIFLGFFGYALTIALFIPMIADGNLNLLPQNTSTSLRAAISGFLLAAYPLGQFLGSPIIGKLSDHYGRKKILMLSLCACLIGFSTIALSIAYQQLPLLFLSCFLTGLVESNMSISQSVIADYCEDATQKIKLIGYAFSACSLGYITGPLVGGIGAAQYGYGAPFWITAVGVLGLILWVQFGFKEISVARLSKTMHLWEALTAFKTIFTHRKLRRLYLLNFLIFFSVQGLYRVVPLYVQNEWHPNLQTFTLLIAVISLLCLLANMFVMGWAAKRFKTEHLLRGLLFIGGISTIVIVFPQHFSWIWLTYGIAVLPTVMLLTTCTSWLSDHATREEQGQVLGNNQALLVLGESLSAAVGGLIAAIMIPLPVVVMGSILLLMIFLLPRSAHTK